jgi:hypothetical protein
VERKLSPLRRCRSTVPVSRPCEQERSGSSVKHIRLKSLFLFFFLLLTASFNCFVDAAYGNCLKTRRSTYGIALTFAGGAIVYKAKTQSVTALSSTEAEFMAAVLTAKLIKYLRMVLFELGFAQLMPTPIYEDNQAAINMIDAGRPTERAHHFEIQWFVIQEWHRRGDIILHHIPGVNDPADGLTKALGWVLSTRHARRLMGHMAPPSLPFPSDLVPTHGLSTVPSVSLHGWRATVHFFPFICRQRSESLSPLLSYRSDAHLHAHQGRVLGHKILV